MGSSRRQPNSDGGEDSANAIIALLKGRGHRIEQKFSSGRADDISSSYIRTIISDLNKLNNTTNDRRIKNKIHDIQNHCYAALANYKEPQNRALYFQELRIVFLGLKNL